MVQRAKCRVSNSPLPEIEPQRVFQPSKQVTGAPESARSQRGENPPLNKLPRQTSSFAMLLMSTNSRLTASPTMLRSMSPWVTFCSSCNGTMTLRNLIDACSNSTRKTSSRFVTWVAHYTIRVKRMRRFDTIRNTCALSRTPTVKQNRSTNTVARVHSIANPARPFTNKRSRERQSFQCQGITRQRYRLQFQK